MESQISKTPATRKLPLTGVGWLDIGAAERELVNQVMDRGLVNRFYSFEADAPPQMAETLEREFRQKMGREYALAVTSGTAALGVALDALEIGPGDEVILPAYSWISCATAVLRCGARPVLAEIDETLNLAPGEIARLSTPQTKAALVVHYQGVAADMEPIFNEAAKRGLIVIEDCASSCGASYRGRRVGSMGTIGCYSFQTNKMMTCGDGGMVVMDDARLFERAVRAHDLGLVRPVHEKQLAGLNQPGFAGAQYRMTELNAAVALAQLRKLDGYITRCREMTARVMKKIGNLPGLTFRRIPDASGDLGIESYFWPDSLAKTVKLRERIAARGVDCNKRTKTYSHFYRDYISARSMAKSGSSPLMGPEPWPVEGYRPEDFPFSEDIGHRMLALPMSILFSDDDVDFIANAVCEAHAEVIGG